MTNPEYDVCLSFAGEQRAYVDQVAELLKQKKIEVFYDRYEQVNLWGRDLYEHLDSVYRDQARYCIIFASKQYAEKVWTSHERRSAQARALTENSEYILPARFDDTEIPGVRPTVGYIDLRVTTPEQLVAMFAEKLNGVRATASEAPLAANYSLAPVSDNEQATLLSVRPEAWEYMLFAGVISRGKIKLQSKLRDHQIKYARRIRRISDDIEAVNYLADRMGSVVDIAESFMNIFSPEAQEWAFGAQGEPGDPENIIHLGNRFTDCYEDFLDWAADLRGIGVDDGLKKLYELGALFVELPIRQIGDFINSYVSQLSGITERIAAGETEVGLEVNFTLSVDESVSEKYAKERDRVMRSLGK
ncbi:TIR domain-containing protein [Lentzea sp. NBRC 102530]|uniref:toll/interleukin-1 receptor domain-containing protein n=1 Tax=Lentzea sp. NBRC 102530 TaxID=3032201 RepID=UPI002556C963|nr:TIR domain-containing protein [Lentzea sp. NBRC 102530]